MSFILLFQSSLKSNVSIVDSVSEALGYVWAEEVRNLMFSLERVYQLILMLYQETCDISEEWQCLHIVIHLMSHV